MNSKRPTVAVNPAQLGFAAKRAALESSYRKDALVDMIVTIVAAFPEPIDIVKTCVTCINFDKDKEVCKLCNMRPPATVIAFGCQRYNEFRDQLNDDDIPF